MGRERVWTSAASDDAQGLGACKRGGHDGSNASLVEARRVEGWG